MASPSMAKIGRNDPCPCGSGKKYKRCCLAEQAAAFNQWSKDREASDQLTRDMMSFAARYFGKDLETVWQDFEMSDYPEPLEEHEDERQIFMPYFLFQWDPEKPRRGKSDSGNAGLVTRLYVQEKGGQLTEMERLFLEQAATQPLSFYEVVWSKPGERIEIRDVLIGGETEVVERKSSRTVREGDILYAQVWNLTGYSILGCTAPLCIPPKWKTEVIGLRKKLQRKIAKQKRDLAVKDLVRYAEEIREAYLDLRDDLHTPPRFANTDGDPLVFHTLTFHVESAQAAFEALAPLALVRPKKELLEEAQFDEAGKLQSMEFDWLKKGNRKMSTWENTILGSIKISEHSLIVEVNSENRAERVRSEIEKRLGGAVVHQSTVAKTTDEMLAELPKRKQKQGELDDEIVEEMLRDPEARKRIQDSVQKQVEAWAHEKVPLLGGRTPMQAIKDPEGREIVESLLVQWERSAEEGAYNQGIQPDIGALRRILKMPASSS